MSVIQKLDQSLVEKIAAGEVVERPASVVKELVENALDAGATNITVEILEGGLTSMRVTDNGVGMSPEDAVLCFAQHATSKIHKEDDLFTIATLGFRGEALSSISAVSKVTLYTRQKGAEMGIMVENHGGKIISQKGSGRPEGTTIIVEDLFYNIPARLKFLKRPSSEAGQISSMMLKTILARPDVAFRFIANGKDVYRSMGDGDLYHAIFAVYGEEICTHMIPLSYRFEDIQIEGYIGDDSIARGSRSQQSLFVNGRTILSDPVANAVKQGYLNRIMPAKFPVFVLNLTIPYDSVDVNVHPNKLDVRFVRNDMILECFYKAVRQTLDDHYTKKPESFTAPKQIDPFHEEPSGFTQKKQSAVEMKEKIASKLNDFVQSEQVMPPKHMTAAQSVIPALTKVVKQMEEKVPEPQPENVLLPNADIDEYRIIGQLFKTYILVEYRDNFLMIDQHAAHERINTDKYMKELENKQVASQGLLIPYVLQLTDQEYRTVQENLSIFTELGFALEDFGDRTMKITAVPFILGEPQLKHFFLDALDAIESTHSLKLELKKHKVFQSACKHSVKAGDKLSQEEIRHLIVETIDHNTPLHCPHGRPIVMIKTKAQIEKMFGRIV